MCNANLVSHAVISSAPCGDQAEDTPSHVESGYPSIWRRNLLFYPHCNASLYECRHLKPHLFQILTRKWYLPKQEHIKTQNQIWKLSLNCTTWPNFSNHIILCVFHFNFIILIFIFSINNQHKRLSLFLETKADVLNESWGHLHVVTKMKSGEISRCVCRSQWYDAADDDDKMFNVESGKDKTCSFMSFLFCSHSMLISTLIYNFWQSPRHKHNMLHQHIGIKNT